MFFIRPMWQHESQRIGKQKCTPVGSAMHVVADLFGLFGLLFLLAWPGVLIYKGIRGTFHASLLWGLLLPFVLDVISEVLYRCSWTLALRKGFRYDSERCEASWMEAGERRIYKYGVSDSIPPPREE